MMYLTTLEVATERWRPRLHTRASLMTFGRERSARASLFHFEENIPHLRMRDCAFDYVDVVPAVIIGAFLIVQRLAGHELRIFQLGEVGDELGGHILEKAVAAISIIAARRVKFDRWKLLLFAASIHRLCRFRHRFFI